MAFTLSDNMAIGADGNLLMRMGANMALGMDSGEMRTISSWPQEKADEDN